MSGKRRISYFDEETTSSRRIRLLECFLLVLIFRFQGAFSRSENEFIVKSEICCLEEKAHFSQSWKGVASEKKRIFHRVEKALLRRKSGFITGLKALIRRKGGFITELKALIQRKDGFATKRIAWCVVLKPFKQSYVAAAHQKSVWKSCFFGIIFLKSHWLYVVYHI